MKIIRFGLLFVLLGGSFSFSGCDSGVTSSSSSEFESYEQQTKAAALERERNPVWKPAAEEVGVIRVVPKGKTETLQSFCLYTNGNILACVAHQSKSPGKTSGGEIRVLEPSGKVASVWQTPMAPEAICAGEDGSIYAAGQGLLLKFESSGKLLLKADAPGAKGQGKRPNSINSIAVSGDKLFITSPSPSDYSFLVHRTSLDFKDAKEILKGLRGCCGQMDVQVGHRKLWIAHNGKHLVESYDYEGKKLSSFGKHSRTAADGFGGCCEPKNVRVGTNGEIYTAESGPPVCIKRFSPEGKFVGVVALPKFDSDCVKVTLDVSPDSKRFYILSTGENAIHVLSLPSGSETL